MILLRSILIFVSGLALLHPPLQAQFQGEFLFRNFTAQEIKASDWIQSIAQDNRGIIYAGNNLGTILEYDGSMWRTISATNGPIRCLKSDASGRIYVGSFGDFGYLEPSDNGEMKYHSLMDLVPEDDKNISDVWSIEIFGNDIYFRSVERIFRYRNGRITPFRTEYGWFGNMISLDDELFATIDYAGIILQVSGDSLTKFYESSDYTNLAFGASAPYDAHTKLVGSWGGGVFVFCPGNLNKPGRKVLERMPYPEALSNKNLLKAVEVYLVEPGIYAARTDNSITVFNHRGAELTNLNTRNGLKSSLIETVFSDRDQVLWIGTERGITHVDISSPISSWYSIRENTGTVWGVTSYKDSIYIWGINGIFRLNNKGVEKILEETYDLVEFTEPGNKSATHLLAINYNSLVEIKNNRLQKLITFPEPLLYQQIFISKLHPDRIYLYGANGLYLIRFYKGGWIWEDNIADVNVGIQSFSEDASGDLWLAVSNSRRLIRLMPEKKDPEEPPVEYFKQLYNPSEEVATRWIRCFTVKSRSVFGTDKGLFRFDAVSNGFVHDTVLGERFTDGMHAVYTLKEDEGGKVFIADRMHRLDDVGLSIPEAKGASWYSRPFLNLTSHIRIYDACFDSKGNVWMVTHEGLSKYDPSKDRKMPGKFNTLIREVISGKSVLFHGSYANILNETDHNKDIKLPVMAQPDYMIPELPYRMNSVMIRYAAVNFVGHDQNLYQYMLEGFEKEWSAWTPQNSKEYSNLQEGRYIFRVKGKNVFGIESEEAIYQFTILPPWYRTVWAYFAYFLAASLLVYGIVMLNLRRLRSANLLLEASVKERTAEVVEQKEEILMINENLLVKQEELQITLDTLYDMQDHLIRSEKLASLGQLIAGIAHEINTPLGTIKASVNDINNNSQLILSLLPELIRKLDEKEFNLFVELVNRSTRVIVPTSSKQDRLYKRALQKHLEEKKIPDPANKADTLVDMGIYDDIDHYLTILNNGNDNFLQVAYQLSQLIRNSKNVEISIERASRIVYALKNYSHMHINEERIEADVTEGIITVLTLFQNQTKKGIHLTTDFEPIPRIYCYPDELNQVWTNLISNAIDAMDRKGELTVSAKRVKDQIAVSISDTGTGIPANIQPRIFDAFFSTKQSGEGSGLGLFIIKEIVDKHGGKISFETQEGQGTTFTVTLPVLAIIPKS